MKHIHFDSIGGASGDMVLACLLGLGADIEELNQLLAKLQVEPLRIVQTVPS